MSPVLDERGVPTPPRSVPLPGWDQRLLMPTPTPPSRHRMVMGGSSRHHEKLGVSFTPMKADPGCGQTLQCQVGSPNASRQIKHHEEEHEAPLAVLIATPLQTWPVQVRGPSSLVQGEEQRAHSTPRHPASPQKLPAKRQGSVHESEGT